MFLITSHIATKTIANAIKHIVLVIITYTPPFIGVSKQPPLFPYIL